MSGKSSDARGVGKQCPDWGSLPAEEKEEMDDDDDELNPLPKWIDG